MKARKPVSAIIFDCDGVLVDSDPISNRVFIDMVNEWSGEEVTVSLYLFTLQPPSWSRVNPIQRLL
jgi:beta-phosphoglucomutase-like phosphatase (HAD superfamily)